MEKNMDGVNRFIDNFIFNLEANGLFWLIVILCSIIFVLIFWLILRKARLWYWKVNEQLDALNHIDRKLQEIKQGLENDAPVENNNIKIPALEPQADQELSNALPENQNNRCAKGKSGKIYTEMELEAIIKE